MLLSIVPRISSCKMSSKRVNVKDKKSQGDHLESELYESVKAHFHNSGAFRKLKGQLRIKVLENVRGESSEQPINAQSADSRESSSCPIQFTCSLIDEFLDWMGFQYTREMLATESGIDISQKLLKMKVAERYQNCEHDEKLPTLLNIVSDVIDNVEIVESSSKASGGMK